MRLGDLKDAVLRTYDDVRDNHTLQMAAALSYYFVMPLFPALIFLWAIVTYLPVPDLFNQALNLMGRFVPPDSMGIVKKVLADVVRQIVAPCCPWVFWAPCGQPRVGLQELNETA